MLHCSGLCANTSTSARSVEFHNKIDSLSAHSAPTGNCDTEIVKREMESETKSGKKGQAWRERKKE